MVVQKLLKAELNIEQGIAGHLIQQEVVFLDRQKETLLRLARNQMARRELLIFGAKEWIVRGYTELSELMVRLTDPKSVSDTLDLKETQAQVVRRFFPQLDTGFRSLIYLFVAFNPDYFGMPISQLTFLETAVDGIYASVSNLQYYLSDKLIRDIFSIRNLFECINFKSKVARPENPATYVSHPNGMKIQAKDVSFKYHEKSQPVLRNVNFTIEPGELVSIVGYNGSGFPLKRR
jgi:ABC-type multidrug transport system fused ATPase/permease subunit